MGISNVKRPLADFDSKKYCQKEIQRAVRIGIQLAGEKTHNQVLRRILSQMKADEI